MSLAAVVDDLLTLEELAEHEDDPERRRSLTAVRSHVAGRDRGAKVAEVAGLLTLSQPTVRSWIEAGVLSVVPGERPIRVDVLSVARTKRALDHLRRHGEDRNLLAAVGRSIRDQAALSGDDVAVGLDDLKAGRVVSVGDDLRAEVERSRSQARSSKSA